MSDLTQDELIVLLIAAEGESMMPIGRWEAPLRSLVAKGLMAPQSGAHDPTGMFNCYITPEGRKACNKGDDDNIRALIGANNAVVDARQKASARAEELAVLLAELATYSSSVTGDDKVEALREWARTILTRALELLK
jgi:hypothetical protein